MATYCDPHWKDKGERYSFAFLRRTKSRLTRGAHGKQQVNLTGAEETARQLKEKQK